MEVNLCGKTGRIGKVQLVGDVTEKGILRRISQGGTSLGDFRRRGQRMHCMSQGGAGKGQGTLWTSPVAVMGGWAGWQLWGLWGWMSK